MFQQYTENMLLMIMDSWTVQYTVGINHECWFGSDSTVAAVRKLTESL